MLLSIGYKTPEAFMTDGCSYDAALAALSVCAERLALRLHLNAADAAIAALLRLAVSAPADARRRRQGITLIYAGEERLTALLVYEDRVWGIFVHQAKRELSEILDDLKEFRLGWLPDEIVRGQGGLGTAFAGEMPAEAEGFVPTFVTGARREMMKGQGILVSSAACRG